jgi:hypothetical protein
VYPFVQSQATISVHLAQAHVKTGYISSRNLTPPHPLLSSPAAAALPTCSKLQQSDAAKFASARPRSLVLRATPSGISALPLYLSQVRMPECTSRVPNPPILQSLPKLLARSAIWSQEGNVSLYSLSLFARSIGAKKAVVRCWIILICYL